MKKLLTITSILAAGTLGASATTILWTTPANASATGADEVLQLTLSGSSAGTTTTVASTTKLGDSTNTVSLTFTASGGNLWNTNSSFTATSTNSALTAALLEDTGLTLSQFGGSGGQTAYGPGGGGSSATLTFNNLEAETDYRFSFVFITNSSAGTLSVGTGTLVTTDNCSYYGVVNAAGDGGTTVSYLSDTATSITVANNTTFYAASIVVTSDSNGVVSFSATQKPWFSAIALTTIPEPSMFGLLAGTLALGLAGTRRRRR